MHAHPGGNVDRLVGVVDPHVHVHAEDQLLARHEAQRADQVAVTGSRDDALVLPHRERVRARRTNRELLPRGGVDHLTPKRAQLGARDRDVGTGVGRDLEHRFHQLGFDLAGGSRFEQRLDGVDELERLGIEDHQLLLDPERVRRPRESMLHARSVPVRPADLTGAARAVLVAVST